MAEDFISVGRPLPRIAGVVARSGTTVRIRWADKSEVDVDLMPAFASHRTFVRLRSDMALFQTVRVNEFGDALEWADGSELAAVWIEELTRGELKNAEFRDAMDKLNMSLDGMAAHLGIARRLVADYRKDKPIPKTVALATRYLLLVRSVPL